MQTDEDIKRKWRQIRDILNKMVNMGDRSVPLILARIQEMLSVTLLYSPVKKSQAKFQNRGYITKPDKHEKSDQKTRQTKDRGSNDKG